MPQTKFVLGKALANNLRPIVIINKIDKPGSRIAEVENELADLFLELAVHEDQLHYPVYYANGRAGKAWKQMPDSPDAPGNLDPIFDAVIQHIPAPQVEPDKPFQMLATALAWDNYKGKYAVGRITRGRVKAGDAVAVCKKDGTVAKGRVELVFMSHGLSKFEVAEGVAGDIVQLTGLPDVQIGETIADVLQPEALPVIEVEAPTLEVSLGPNTSPFKGLEGEFNTSRQIGERLKKELETNIGLSVVEEGIGYKIAGRGELHICVLIETMRREGYEFEVGRPQVVTKQQDGKTFEPIEELIIEVPAEHVGGVQMELGQRRAQLKEQFSSSSKGVTKLVYELPTRALLGLRSSLITQTKGTIVMNSLMVGHRPAGQVLQQTRSGALVAYETGTTTPFALQNAEDRGTIFVPAGARVYAGQIVGLNRRGDDLEINVCKAKQLTNLRSSSSDGVVQLTPPTVFSLEQCLDFIENDESLEVTPKSLRLRKRELDPNKRKRHTR